MNTTARVLSLLFGYAAWAQSSTGMHPRMATKKKRGRPPSIPPLHRIGTVTSWDSHVSIGLMREAGMTERWVSTVLTVRGDLDEPVRGSTQFELSVRPDDTRSISVRDVAGVGVVMRVKPCLQMAVSLLPLEYASVHAIACAGRLKTFSLSLMPPRYGSGPMTWVGFDTSVPDSGEG